MKRSIGLFGAVLTLLTACAAPLDQASRKTTIVSPEQCAKDKLVLVTPGKLTIGVEKPTYEPWFIGLDPSNGKGFESALAYEIGRVLGFTNKADVVWVDQVFNDAIAPTPKPWDLDINEFTITEERAKVVDFSDPYYDNDQALVVSDRALTTKRPTPTYNDVSKLNIGAQGETTSHKAASLLRPEGQVAIYDNHDAVVLALRAGQIDGMVTDAPTAMLMMTKFPGVTVLARLVRNVNDPEESKKREQFGAVLPKGSPLLPCINWAIQELSVNGKIKALQEHWLKDLDSIPEITLPKR